jgi:restriction system protein
MGFEATTTRYVGDKGIDITGKLNAEGLTNLSLQVQVKRVTGSLGIDQVLQLRGTLGPDDHGALITTSTFTPQAREEALNEKKKQIALIDGEALSDLILEHYDDLDEEYKKILPLKPKEIPLNERFTMLA